MHSMRNVAPRLRRLLSNYGVAGAARVLTHRMLLKRLIPIARPIALRRLTKWLQEDTEQLTFLIRSSLDADYPYRQRVHHIAEELAHQGQRVVFITPSTGHDKVIITSHVSENLMVTPHGEAAIVAAQRPIYLALSTDATLSQSEIDQVIQRKGFIIYDYIDHMDDGVSSHPLSEERLRLHDQILADQENVLVLASADALLRDVATRRSRNMLLVTNGVEVERFKGIARERAGLRADFAHILTRSRPILGYYGSLASWFDYGLVRRLAEARPGYDVVLIGPDLDGTGSALAQGPSNLFVLPAMRYEELPRHAAWFDVCLVPFIINDVTLATSPLKIFEYMALGRPTVSTDLPECRKYQSVFTAAPDEFAATCDHALTLEGPAFRETAQLESEENSWGKKVDAIVRSITGAACKR